MQKLKKILLSSGLMADCHGFVTKHETKYEREKLKIVMHLKSWIDGL